MMEVPFKLRLINETTVDIPRALLEQFRFFNAIYSVTGLDEFVEHDDHTLDISLWQSLITACQNTHDITEDLKECDFTTLYSLIHAIDFYDIARFLMPVIKILMRRLLGMTPEQLRDVHHMKRLHEPTIPTTMVEAILPDYARHRAMIDAILRQYIGVTSLITLIEEHFMPRAEHFIAVGRDLSFFITTQGVFTIGRTQDENGVSRPESVLLPDVISVASCASCCHYLTRNGSLYRDGPHGPIHMENLDLVLSVACGDCHVIALTTDGVYVWGDNSAHQLGVDDWNDCDVPMRMDIDACITKIYASLYSSILLSDAGDVYHCGYFSSYGYACTLTKLALPGPAKEVACCEEYMLIILRDDSFYQYGKLPNGDKFRVPTRLDIPFIDTPVKCLISCAFCIVVIGENDAFYTIGSYRYGVTGHLGIESHRKTSFTRLFDTLHGVIDVASTHHTLILKNDGLYGMGNHIGLGLANDVSKLTRLSIEMGHEKYNLSSIDASAMNKRRKIDTVFFFVNK